MSKSIDRQEHQDAAYVHAYRQWIASLPETERATLVELDLAEPDTKRRTHNYDPELALALATSNPWNRDDGEADADSSTPRRAEKDPLLAFDTLCFATGLGAVFKLPSA